jgi:putative SOS response-associated peptidase YedK
MVLTTREEIDVWINAPAADVLKLQRPLADNTLKIVARETKRTGAVSRYDVHRRCDYAAT